jgi:dodecin
MKIERRHRMVSIFCASNFHRVNFLDLNIKGEKYMAVVKVVEIIAESEKGWAEAAQEGIANTAKTVRNIQSAYVKDMQAKVENDKISKYRVNLQISFLVEGTDIEK